MRGTRAAAFVSGFLLSAGVLFAQPPGGSGQAAGYELSVQLYELVDPTCSAVFLSRDARTAYFVDQVVTMIDLQTGRLLRSFGARRQLLSSGGSSDGGASGYRVEYHSIASACLVEAGDRVLTVDGTLVRVWAAATGTSVADIAVPGAGELRIVRAVSGGRHAVTADLDGRLFLLDLDTGASRRIPAAPMGRIEAMACSNAGFGLLAASARGILFITDIRDDTGSPWFRTWPWPGAAGGGSAVSVDFSDDDRLLLASRSDGIAIYDTRGSVVEAIPASGVLQACFDRDPSRLYVYSAGWNDDGSSAIVVYDRTRADVDSVFPNLFPGYGGSFDLDAGAGLLLTSNYHLWDIRHARRTSLQHTNRLSVPAPEAIDASLLIFDGLGLDMASLTVGPRPPVRRRPTEKSAVYDWDRERGVGIYRDVDFFHDDRLYVATPDGATRHPLPRLPGVYVHCAALSPDGSRVAFGDLNGGVYLAAVGGTTAQRLGAGSSKTVERLRFRGEHLLVAGDSEGFVHEWDLRAGRLNRRVRIADGAITAMAEGPREGRYVVGDINGNVHVLDADYRPVSSLRLHAGPIGGVLADRAGRLLFVSSNGVVKILDIATNHWIAFTADRGGREWICFTDDGYWEGSAACTDLLAMVAGFEVYGIDQFAARNNRPDIILERLGYADRSLIDHFRSQYAKRLRRLGLSEQLLSADLRDVPQARILSTTRGGRSLSLAIELDGGTSPVASWNLWINNVPLFGATGRRLDQQRLQTTETVLLNPGDNKIEVGCLNRKGIEAYRVPVSARFDGELPARLYFLGFGVSRYADHYLDLGWAAKDAEDLAAFFAGFRERGYERVVAHAFTDAEVTPAAVRQAKTIFADARPEDTVVLFIAGHGVHDRDTEATYYFLTHEADLDNLAQTSARFEDVEDLLQGIAPRRKLFLMDTCESGEADEEDAVAVADDRGRGARSRSIRGLVSLAPSVRHSLADRNRWIYNDVVRRSGAVVFSSCRGNEVSYEFDDLQNGAFTSALLACLDDPASDLDGDGMVAKDELQVSVSRRVSALVLERVGEDLQHPTVDRDNLEESLKLPAAR